MRKLEVEHAVSNKNGIRFYSKRHKGCVAVSEVDDDGNIKTEWTTNQEIRKKEKKTKMSMSNIKSILIIYPLSFVYTVVTEWLMSIDPMAALRFSLIGYALIILCILFIVALVKEKDMHKFHAAEHMVLNGYEKLKRVPSMDEIKKYSRFHNSCGTNIITGVVLTLVMMFGCTYIPNPMYMVMGMLISIIMVQVLSDKGLLNFGQYMTTKKPTEKELLVAIQGLTVWVENEKKEKEKTGIRKFLQRLFPGAFS